MAFTEDYMVQFLRASMRGGDLDTISERSKLTIATNVLASGAILQTLGPDWCEKHITRKGKVCDYFQAKAWRP